MKPAPILACLLALALPGSALSQSTDAARADGKETARELLETARDSASAPVDANRLPNFDPAGVQGLETLADDPDRIESNSRSAAQVHEGYRAMEESLARRARFDPTEIEAVIARAGAINDAPLDYTSGMAIGGSQGQCVELPPGSASAGTYIATCNSGTSGELVDANCTASLMPEVTTTSEYDYYCLPNNAPDDGKWSCTNYTGGSCYLYQTAFVPCYQLPQFSSIPCRGQNMIEVHRFRCGEQIASACRLPRLPPARRSPRLAPTPVHKRAWSMALQSPAAAGNGSANTSASKRYRAMIAAISKPIPNAVSATRNV
jgi:conjugal transfer mating pair stabilization protein TraN